MATSTANENYRMNTCSYVGIGIDDGKEVFSCHYCDNNTASPCHCANCPRYDRDNDLAEEYESSGAMCG